MPCEKYEANRQPKRVSPENFERSFETFKHLKSVNLWHFWQMFGQTDPIKICAYARDVTAMDSLYKRRCTVAYHQQQNTRPRVKCS